MDKIICLSFDVEEWDPPVIYNVEHEDSMSTQFCADGTEILLDLFLTHEVKTTFFVTGVFAKNHPKIIKRMQKEGHDVGGHGDVHKPLWKLSKDELYQEISKGKQKIEKSTSMDVLGFRSPRNMVNPYLYDVLNELGFEYDSSVHPALVPGRWLDVLKKRNIHEINNIKVVPSSTMIGLPISWWWMRNLGVNYSMLGSSIALKLHNYCLLYFHSWEAVEVPKVKGVPNHMTKNIGKTFMYNLQKYILNFKNKGYCFDTIPKILNQKV